MDGSIRNEYQDWSTQAFEDFQKGVLGTVPAIHKKEVLNVHGAPTEIVEE